MINSIYTEKRMQSTAKTHRPDGAEHASALFQGMADSTRLRCLILLATHGELCVCELVHALELSQPMISRHLRQLRDLSLVADRRQRVWVHYRIHDAAPAWIRSTLDAVAAAQAEASPFADDRARLAAMPDRPGGRCSAPSSVVR